MSVLIHSAGFLTSIQDAGRFGYEKYGIPCSGPMDRFALYAANLLVGNSWDAAGLEFCISGPALVMGDDCLIAAAGSGFSLVVNGRPMPFWMSIFARRGDYLEFSRSGDGNWGYLAVSSGIALPLLMGSRSTYLKGKIGGLQGTILKNGDILPLFPQPDSIYPLAGRCVLPESRPVYQTQPTIHVIPGPQDERFTSTGLDTFYNSLYHISSTSDRMGYRLDGPQVEHTSGADMLSDGMAFGSIQVPANGQPIVMMSEHPTTGGYTKIATVISADLPVLAQCVPGVDSVRFAPVTIEIAQQRYRRLINNLEACIKQTGYNETDYIQ
ncbi:MAG: biotin-dependent carboxyltransferase family protein [Chloroflexi bacterium]|nr:biotin-dependent carboxyltransferase family protein [Chloroflexota bacterium]